MTGAATCGTNGKCWVSFSWWGRPDTSRVPNYNVLSTDYDNYVIVYSCQNRWSSKRESVWIMTRNPDFSDAEQKKYTMMLKVLYPKLDQSEMIRVLQGNDVCTYV